VEDHGQPALQAEEDDCLQVDLFQASANGPRPCRARTMLFNAASSAVPSSTDAALSNLLDGAALNQPPVVSGRMRAPGADKGQPPAAVVTGAAASRAGRLAAVGPQPLCRRGRVATARPVGSAADLPDARHGIEPHVDLQHFAGDEVWVYNISAVTKAGTPGRSRGGI
jgi:hypothetical protein